MSSEEEVSTFPEGIPLLDATADPLSVVRPELFIITGMSGAGRSRAAAALEDLDWYVVDNLPPRLIKPLAGMLTGTGEGVHRLAVVVDVRSKGFFNELSEVLSELRESNIAYRIVFLDASDKEIVRRYEQVRRPHPLQGDGTLLDGIRSERMLLQDLRMRADQIMDTTSMSVHDLARKTRDLVATDTDMRLRVTVMSFGFKHGLPLDADHVVDVRFIANPYWVTELRKLTGLDKPVSDYVLSQPGVTEFADRYVEALGPALGGYINELKPFVTLAVGCTGGRHRSVAMSEAIAQRLRNYDLAVSTVHRDSGKE